MLSTSRLNNSLPKPCIVVNPILRPQDQAAIEQLGISRKTILLGYYSIEEKLGFLNAAIRARVMDVIERELGYQTVKTVHNPKSFNGFLKFDCIRLVSIVLYAIGGGTVMFALFALAGDIGCAGGPFLVGRVSAGVGDDLRTGILAALVFPVLLILGVLASEKTKEGGGRKQQFRRLDKAGKTDKIEKKSGDMRRLCRETETKKSWAASGIVIACSLSGSFLTKTVVIERFTGNY